MTTTDWTLIVLGTLIVGAVFVVYGTICIHAFTFAYYKARYMALLSIDLDDKDTHGDNNDLPPGRSGTSGRPMDDDS